MDNGSITAMDVAKACFSSNFNQLMNKGTNISPPPAPNNPFNSPASPPMIKHFAAAPTKTPPMIKEFNPFRVQI